MFDDDYYRVVDAAQQLGMNPQQLLRQAATGKIQICVVFSKRPLGKFEKIDTSKPMTSSVLFNALDVLIGKKSSQAEELKTDEIQATKSINVGEKKVSVIISPMFFPHTPYIAIFSLDYLPVQTTCPDITSFRSELPCPSLMKLDDDGLPIDDCVYVPPKELMITPCTDLVITHQELTRLKALKAQHDGKPTLEQLQAENEALKLRIAELAESQALATCEISSKSKAPIAATFKAIRALAPDITIDAIESRTQLDGNSVSRSTIANYLNGKI